MLSYLMRRVFGKLNKMKGLSIFKEKKYSLIVIVPVILLVGTVFAFEVFFWGKIFPNIYITKYYVGGLKPTEAVNKVNSKLKIPDELFFSHEDQQFSMPTASINLNYDVVKSVDKAYYVYRSGNIFHDFKNHIYSLFTKRQLGLDATFDAENLQKNLSVFAGQVATEPIYPSVRVIDGKIVVNKGQEGKDIETDILKGEVARKLASGDFSNTQLKTRPVDPTINDEQADDFKKRAESLLDKNLVLEYEFQKFEYNKNDILKLLYPDKGFNTEEIALLIAEVSNEVNREPQNAVFVFQEGKVKEFSPAKDGLAVEEDKLEELIKKNIYNLESSEDETISVSIPVETTSPTITTENVNNLGINELIGRGTSKYKGSISSRIHNIALAAGTLNGSLVAPGEVFSFNDTLGDVSVYTGYKQAYVIRDGKTVLGDGGGVCQVSTTLFRAILDAGLPIVERRAHSYRVSYYEQESPPGLDATVYAPTTDLKFKNDTPGYLLIQSITDTKNYSLAFEIYGTSDGRLATITKPVVTSVLPPPEDLYIDDPTLPEGTIKQIDYKAWGAKVVFNYSVTRDGETIYEKTFNSNYHPWQAKFLRGTGPAI
jgi:vancomycin resistance protein YoaR